MNKEEGNQGKMSEETLSNTKQGSEQTWLEYQTGCECTCQCIKIQNSVLS